MSNEWITVEKQKNELIVKVTLPKYTKQNKIDKIKIKTSDVKSYISSLGHKISACRLDPGPARNAVESQRDKTWIFELEKKSAPVRKRAKRVKKVEKILDKSPEHVIIEVEKKETPTLSETQPVTEE
jgi:hypothetical protein